MMTRHTTKRFRHPQLLAEDPPRGPDFSNKVGKSVEDTVYRSTLHL